MQEQAYLQAVHEEEEASCSWVLEAADTYCANRLTVGSGMSAEQCGEAVLRQSPTPYPATDPVSRQVVMQVRPPRLPNPTLRHTRPECSLDRCAVAFPFWESSAVPCAPIQGGPSRVGDEVQAKRAAELGISKQEALLRVHTTHTTHHPLRLATDTCGGPGRAAAAWNAR